MEVPDSPGVSPHAAPTSKCFLRVSSLTGEILLHGSIDASTTVARIKEDVEVSEGIPLNEQLLLIDGTPLSDSDALRTCVVASGDAADETAPEAVEVVLRKASPEWTRVLQELSCGHTGFEHARLRVRMEALASQQDARDCSRRLAHLVQDMNTVFQSATKKVTESGSSLLAAAGFLQRNRDTVFEVAPRSSKGCRQAAEELTICRNSVLAAVQSNGQVLQAMQAELGPAHEAVMTCLQETATALSFAKEFGRREGELLRVGKARGWLYAGVAEDLVRSYNDSVKATGSDSDALEATAEHIAQCRQAYRRAIVVNRNAIKQAEASLQRDQEIIFGWAADHVSEIRKCDRKFIMTIIESNGEALERAPEEFKGDKEVVLLAVRQSNGWALQFATEAMKSDREVVLAAVKRNGWALEHAGEELKRDHGVVLAAVQANGEAIEFAAESMRADREVVMTAIAGSGGWALQVAAQELRSDVEVASTAVKQNPLILEHVSEELRNDRVLVLSAVQANGLALEHASLHLREDPAVVEAAIRANSSAFRFAAPKLQADREMVKKVVLQDGYLLQYASEGLRGERELVLEAVSEGGTGVLEFAARELRSDPHLVAVAVVSSQRKLQQAEGGSGPSGGSGAEGSQQEPVVASWNEHRDADLVQL